MTPTDTRLSCLIADDHPAILKSIALFLEDEDIRVVATTATGAEALELIVRRKPAVALVDEHLPDLSGIDVVRRAAVSAPETALLLYTGDASPALARAALDAGALGIVLKEAPLHDLPRAIGMAAAGTTYIDPLLAAQFAKPAQKSTELTKREREVLRGLSQGMTNEQIGAELFLSPETVRTHVRKAIARLGAHTRTEAVAGAVRDGLIV
jgi:DNA-binding NarL/FixJ family response regulator